MRDACRQLNIYPKTSTFFGLSNENNWLIQTKRIDSISLKHWNKLVLTLQFKVLSSNELRKFDETAYLYYVKQVRSFHRDGLNFHIFFSRFFGRFEILIKVFFMISFE